MIKQYKFIRIVAFVCLFLFFYIFFKLGPINILQIIQKVVWYNFLILFFMRFFSWLFRAAIWKNILAQYEKPPPLWQLFLARLSGHAVGYLTPTAKIGGEAARTLMVKTADRKKVFASVIVDKTIELVSIVLLFLIAELVAILYISMPNSKKISFIAFTILITALSIWLLRKQKKGLLIWFVDLLKKMKIKFTFLEKNRIKLKETDTYISDFLTTKKGVFVKTLFLYILHTMIWTSEIYFTFLFLKAEGITFLVCFLLVILGSVSFSVPMIPASLGIYEITYVSLFVLLGINIQFGLAMILVRRILGLIWAGLGMIPILARRNIQKSET
ncbi:lysylphosphatidylglycerol synthase transmembrane domain-containing protein [Acidobacteriota bacterium]